MRPLVLACTVWLAAIPALGDETVVSRSEFRDYATGYTLYFEQDGVPFGSETFGEDGAVQWRFRTGECVEGVWASRGAQLCFQYFDGPGEPPQCWRALRDDDGLMVRLLTSEDAGLELRISGRDTRPLLCSGPSEET